MTAPSHPAMSTSTLSEAESKELVKQYGVPLAAEHIVSDVAAAVAAAASIGGAVAIKLNGDAIAHKTERGLVRLGVSDETAVRVAAQELLAAARPEDGEVSLLVAPMVSGAREFIVGMIRDPQFGPMVMLGVGGILAEVIADVAFRPAPLDVVTAQEQIENLTMSDLLGEFRGEAAVDRQALIDTLVGLGQLAADHPEVMSVDINPLIIDRSGRPAAVDALVEIAQETIEATTATARPQPTDEQFNALFEPSGVVVTGASSHPGKFGFVALHNLLAAGYSGNVYATNRSGEEVLGIRTVGDVSDVPEGGADLMFVCTPASANIQLLEDAAQRGVRAAFLTSAGYGEAGDEGRAAEAELVAAADRLGILLAGPNGQGVVSTPASLCAQIVAPYPPSGGIGVASQSGNFVSSFLNLSRSTGVGVSRAVSAGNAAAVSVADYLDFYSRDEKTAVSLAYIEGITDGRGLMERLAGAARHKPLVVLKGGATAGGARAAASHTGALAADDRIFDGACQAAGVTRVQSVEEAFDTAASFATQPLPKGPNVVILTTAGGWGVVTSDAVTRDSDLTLMQLPDELLAQIDEHLPPRWSRNNPVDCAGGETRDTIPTVMGLIANHPDVHSVIYLGLGIQSNQAREMRSGRFYPDHGLERIVEYHERQDRRFAEAAAELSIQTGKPILVATELALADPNNAGPAAVRASGRLCYATGDRAVSALGHMWRYARFQERRRS
ncbi:MAG: acetate--CoA ligase family protein [Actinomycetota bacterium]|nr:acetate--CoA ligase family protein [Actinomycetota bacterium]